MSGLIPHPSTDAPPTRRDTQARRTRLRRVTLGLGCAALVVGAFAVLSWRATQAAADQVRWVAHTYTVIETLEATLGQILDAEIGAHVFALTGEEAFLGEAFRAAELGLEKSLARLRVLTADNPRQQQRLNTLENQLAATLEARQRIVAERHAAGTPPATQIIARDKALLDAVRTTLAEMKAEELRLVTERSRRAGTANQSSNLFTVLGTLLGVSALLAATLLVKRRAESSARAEAQVRALNSRLEQRVAARTAALREEMAAREQAQSALRFSQQRLAGIIDSAMDAIITVDASRRVVLFNHAAEAMFRCPAARALGQPIERWIPERFHLSPDLRHLGEAGVRSDGEEFPIEASISQVQAGGEQLFTIILRDITERQRAEAALREAKTDLERKVAERTAELREAKERAESADRSKSSFLSGMSHELRTPLNAVIGFTGTLLMKLPGPLTTAQEKQLRTVQSSAKHLLSLINDCSISAASKPAKWSRISRRWKSPPSSSKPPRAYGRRRKARGSTFR